MPPPPLPPDTQYNATGYNDLFDPGNLGQEAVETPPQVVEDGNGPDQSRLREPLETFALHQLNWVGVVGAANSRWALIRDPNGKLHRVTLGNYIGQNHGKIEEITPLSIKIAELRRSASGSWSSHPNRLSRN